MKTAYIRTQSERFLVEHLADGSAAVFDTQTESAHSLNAVAVAVWECCETAAQPQEIARLLSASGAAVDAATVRQALETLARLGLVERTSAVEGVSVARRAALRTLAAGVPVILTLTASAQQAFAQGAGSGANGGGTTGDPGGTTVDPGTTTADPGTTTADPGTTTADPGTTTVDPGTTPANGGGDTGDGDTGGGDTGGGDTGGGDTGGGDTGGGDTGGGDTGGGDTGGGDTGGGDTGGGDTGGGDTGGGDTGGGDT